VAPPRGRESAMRRPELADRKKSVGRSGAFALNNHMKTTSSRGHGSPSTTPFGDPAGLLASAVSDELLTADEVAELLRVTPAWVYAETRRNRIPHVRLGRYVRYRRQSLDAWIAQIESTAGPPLTSGSLRRRPPS
jgi:excisionase family DNA binding protein